MATTPVDVEGTSPSTSLNGVTVVGAGSGIDLTVTRGSHTIIVSYSGSATEVVVALEGSHDGTIWVALDEHDYASGGGARRVEFDVSHVRANLTHLAGSATVKATIASS